MKINTKKLIEYINDYAGESEEQAHEWASDGCFDEAYKAQVIANFLREDLVKGIEMDLIDAEE
jgi:hypothetical protein